jgi:hypothetical protein
MKFRLFIWGAALFLHAFTRGSHAAPLTPLADLTAIYQTESLSLTPAQAHLANLLTLQDLRATYPSVFRGYAPFVDMGEAQQVLDSVRQCPVSNPANSAYYDPRGYLGFCFGRAMAVHLEALTRGLAPDSVLKLWAVGNLQDDDGTRWGYHVTTLLRGAALTPLGVQQVWWAIDPLYERAMTIEQWYAQMRQELDPTKTMRLYSTYPNKFSPKPGEYNGLELLSPAYNGFFRDLLTYLGFNRYRTLSQYGMFKSIYYGANGSLGK